MVPEGNPIAGLKMLDWKTHFEHGKRLRYEVHFAIHNASDNFQRSPQFVRVDIAAL